MCAKTTKYRLESSTPTVKTTLSSDAVSEPSRNVKPTAVISAPKRLLGRRHQAYRPVPMNDAVITRPTAIAAPGCGTWSEASTSALRRAPRRRRRRSATLEQRAAEARHRSACSLSPDSSALGTKPRAPEPGHERAEVGRVAARDEDDDRAVVVAREPGGDVEAVDVGQLDVEQDDLRLEPSGLGQRGRAVRRLSDHVEALGLEKDSRSRAERRMVVHDQDPVTHVHKSGCAWRVPTIRLAAPPDRQCA